ncbi:MAG: helix-turn-helix domain-containing protein [Sphingomonadaceae bacterium]|nr:helix-turn-helix domain-containing protein [Sphingomonadaceae bacterium]
MDCSASAGPQDMPPLGQAERRIGVKSSSDPKSRTNREVYEHDKPGVKLIGSGIDAIPDMLVAARVARGMTQKDLAEFMGLKMQQIQAYEADRFQTTSLSRIAWIAKALGIDLALSGQLVGEHAMCEVDLQDHEAFPVGEMYRRGWLGPNEGGAKEFQRSSKDLLGAFFDTPLVAGRRRYARTRERPHEPALIAWETQLLHTVNFKAGLPRFERERVDAKWIRTLVGLSGKRNGLRQVRQYLAAIGLVLRIEPGLPGMSVDAATVRAPNCSMIVALTFRRQREETFWSALLHAIAHARLHVSLGEWDTVFHDDEAPAFEPWLADADVFAREALIPMSAWGTCRSQAKPTMGVIGDDAKRLGVSPAVLVGRLRHELGTSALPRITFPHRNVAKFLRDD